MSFLFRFAMRNGTQAVPYNHFTNYAVRICKTRRFILSNEFHFSLKDGLWIYLFYSFIEYAPIAAKQKGDGGITRHCPFALMYDFILRNIFLAHTPIYCKNGDSMVYCNYNLYPKVQVKEFLENFEVIIFEKVQRRII